MAEFLKLPSGVDWKGTHEELVEFLEAVYRGCSRAAYLDCGRETTKDCSLCASLMSQGFLDRMLYEYRTRDPQCRYRTGEETLGEYLEQLKEKLDGDGRDRLVGPGDAETRA